METDHADRDVFQAAPVEVTAQLIGLHRRGQSVELAVRVNLTGLGMNRQDDAPVALRELLRRSDQRRLFGSCALEPPIASSLSSPASNLAPVSRREGLPTRAGNVFGPW